jgi:hypothetical protein
MRYAFLAVMASASVFLSGCGVVSAENAPSDHHGRYVGIGVFSVGPLWSQMTVSTKSNDPAAAKIADDEHVIVVVDSQTGEIRECGDYSGHCVSMNPWTRAIAPEQITPVKLQKHASELEADDAVAPSEAKQTPNPPTATP